MKWGTEHSDTFNLSNSVKQGEVISPLLFSCYIDKLFSLLQNYGFKSYNATNVLAGSFE